MTTVLGASVCARDFSYRHGSRIEPALRHIEFTIEPGQRIVLTGVLVDADGDASGTLLIDADSTGLVLQDPDAQTSEYCALRYGSA